MIICKSILASAALLAFFLAPKTFSQGSARTNPKADQGSSENLRQSRKLLDQGVCAFKKKDYVLAQKDFDQALQLDPTNLFLRVFIARAHYWQFQPNVRTAENVAKGREAIAAYEKVIAANAADSESASAIAGLYEQIDAEHLQETAANENLPKDVRKQIYIGLAGKLNTCANDITEQNRSEVTRRGQWSYAYHMPQNKSDLQKGQTCAREGIKLVDKALQLAPNDEPAWSYKASLLYQMARFAEMELHADEHAAYGKQAEQARSVFKKISGEARERQRTADEDELKSEGRPKSAEEQYPEFANFAATGKRIREARIDGSEVDSPVYWLEAPMPNGDETTKEKPIVPIKLPWKTFTANQGEFTASLPSPLDIDGSATYTVRSEGVTYLISSTKIPPAARVSTDALLVGAVFEITGAVCTLLSLAKATCEVRLARKLTQNSYPGVQYNAEKTQCENVSRGLIRVYATKERLYTIIIAGAAENDPRVTKFLTSIVFK
ncbi:MAG: hypothetical protein ABJB40_09135 [Acidobacteriota bacterium]